MTLLAILLMPFHGVSAQIDCDTTIVDAAGILGGNYEAIQSALPALQKYAEVRVITIQTYGSSSLEKYADGIRQSCQSWQAQDGGFKNNLIVFIISVNDIDTAIFYGNEWTNPLDANTARIKGDFMNPKFADGDMSGGFVAGINETARLVELKVNPPAEQSGDQKPIDLSGFFRFLILAAILTAIGLFLFFGYRAYQSHQETMKASRSAQQRARIRKQALTSGIAEWQQLVTDLNLDIQGIAALFDESVTERLNSMVREAIRLYDQMLHRYHGLDNSAGDPDTNGLSADQYSEMTSSYEKVLDMLEAAQDQLVEARDAYAQVRESSTKAPAAVVTAEKALAVLNKAIEAMRAKEFILPDTLVLPIARLVESSRNSLTGKRPDLALQKALSANEQAIELTGKVNDLPHRKEAVQKFIVGLPSRVKRAQARVEEGRKLFDEMDDQYSPNALDPISGNGREAEKRIAALLDIMDDLPVMLEKHQFDKAEEIIANAETWIEEVDSFMHSIVSLSKSLSEAANSMNDEVKTAAIDVRAAQAYLKEHRADLENGIDQLDEALDTAEKALRRALDLLDDDLIDPIQVVKNARLANEGADKVLTNARQQTEAHQRLVKKAETALREATRVVNRAKEFIEDHSNYVSANAKAVLRSAQKNLTTALETADSQRQIDFAEGAEEKGRDAYNEAKEDFEDSQSTSSSSDDDDGDTTIVNVWGSSNTSVYRPANNRQPSNWSAPAPRQTSVQHGSSTNWGSSQQHGSSLNISRSVMHGSSTKWGK